MDGQIYAPKVDLPENSSPHEGMSFSAQVIDFIQTLVVFLVIFVLIYWLIAQPHKVEGNSMLPNVQDGNYILTDKLSYRFGEPKVGDIIVLKDPEDENKDFIKRIVATPGDKLMVQGGKVYLNGNELKENYLPKDRTTRPGNFFQEGKEITAGPDQYFAFGDNRDRSSDSRAWGSFTKEQIKGKVFFRYFPFNEFGLVHSAVFN